MMEPGRLRAVRKVVRYLYRLGDPEASRVAKDVLKSVLEPTQAEVMMRTMEEVLKRQGRREGKKEGRKEGLAEAVLECLADRGIEVDEASRQRIERCEDAELLKHWLRRALRATRLSEVLDEPSAGSTPLPS